MPTARVIEVNGVDLGLSDTPTGAGVGTSAAAILLHETGETSRSWEPMVEAVDGRMRTVAYDRRGWGRSGAPDHYTRTTVSEHAADALAILDRLGIESALFCGCGIGAISALDAAVREPGRVVAVIAVEPPLAFLVPEATEGFSADVEQLTKAAEAGGVRSAAELYASGALSSLGPGADRAEGRSRDGRPAVARPLSLFAEIAAIPAWTITPRDLAEIEVPVSLVTGTASPDIFCRAADRAVDRASRFRRVELAGDPLNDPALAELALELAQA